MRSRCTEAARKDRVASSLSRSEVIVGDDAAKGQTSEKTQPTRRDILQALSASSALALAGISATAATAPQA